MSEGYCEQFCSVFLSHSFSDLLSFHLFALINSKTITLIELKFGGQIFNEVQQIPPNLVKFE